MHKYIQIVHLVFWTVVFSLSSVQGQSDFVTEYRARLNSMDPNSPEYLLEMFELTDALRSHDLNLALVQAQDALKVADRLGDADFQMVARLDEKLIRGILDGRISNRFLADASFQRLDNASRPELKFHFHEALIESAILSDEFQIHIEPFLHATREAADQSANRRLIFRQRCLELYARVVWRAERPDHPKVLELMTAVRADVSHYPDLNGWPLLSLFEFRQAKMLADKPRQVDCLKQALFASQKTGNRFLEFRCLSFQAIRSRQSGKIKKSIELFDDSLQVASRLSAPALTQMTASTVGGLSEQHGNYEQAIEYFVKSEETNSFASSPIPTRNLVYKGLHNSLGRMANSAAAIYEPLVYPRNVIIEIQNKNGQLLQLEESLVQSQSNAEEKIARIQSASLIAEAQSQSRILFFQRYAAIATLVILMLVPWLIVFFIRNRLKTIENDLANEKLHSHGFQVRSEDLALRLSRAQRMESLGLMAGGVAHDFNNILVGVLGNAELIQLHDGNHDRPFILQRVAKIVESAEKAADLSRQMLAYAGKQQIAQQRTDLNQLIRQFESILESACQKKCRLVLRLETHPIIANVDPIQIEQALLNLITNAVAASDNHGEIVIQSGRCKITNQDDPTVFGTSKFLGDFCFIEVCDYGRGISESEKERIFEPFFTNSDKGRGLGLSVVYGVMEGHNGLIQCQSEVGKGTSFRLLLPAPSDSFIGDGGERLLNDREEFGRSEANEDDTPTAANGQTILIIDDEEAVIELCQELLEIDGWKVLTANCGEAGLKKLLQHHNELSCVLMDVMMPELGANELLKEMESNKILVPVVLISGFSQTRLDFFFTRRNVAAIVSKPFRAGELQQAVLLAAQKFRVNVEAGTATSR